MAQIARTVRRTPEVMVKVSGGGSTPGAVAAHFQYVSRNGELDIETDDGDRVQGKDEVKSLAEDWGLDLDAMTCWPVWLKTALAPHNNTEAHCAK